ncbi:hypothetical protein RA27_14245 [Ruegeria sp. ANG-R]|nr:hypothetical protein RA27_14245 [Ruegeria sp. ANG-R]
MSRLQVSGWRQKQELRALTEGQRMGYGKVELLWRLGGTTAQIDAWTGYESLSEIERYIRNFNKRMVLSSTEQEQKAPTSAAHDPAQNKK